MNLKERETPHQLIKLTYTQFQTQSNVSHSSPNTKNKSKEKILQYHHTNTSTQYPVNSFHKTG